MIMYILLASLLLGFLAVFMGTPYAKRYLLLSGIIGVDQNKEDKPRLPTSGGIVVLFGFILAVTSYLGLSALTGTGNVNVALTLAAMSSAILIALIGLLDDIHVNLSALIEEDLEIESGEFKLAIHQRIDEIELPHQKFWTGITSGRNRDSEMLREGLNQFSKMLFVLPAALPLIAVGAGSWTMHLPVIGEVYWGIIYPLVLLPLGLLFVSNVVNMLAGTNGLSASMSMVAATSLGVYAYMNGRVAAAVIAFSLSACLIAFLRYNYTGSILPGDSLTYLAGAAIFSAMVIGNIEKFGVFIFIPWFVEFFLKLRSGFQAHSWGNPVDGKLEPTTTKTYSLTHPLMRRGFTEKQITLVLAGTETLICVAGLLLFNAGIL